MAAPAPVEHGCRSPRPMPVLLLLLVVLLMSGGSLAAAQATHDFAHVLGLSFRRAIHRSARAAIGSVAERSGRPSAGFFHLVPLCRLAPLACVHRHIMLTTAIRNSPSHTDAHLARFYEAQMSGDVPTWSRAHQFNGGWRNTAHGNDGRGPNGIGMDVSGGWYDAGGTAAARNASCTTSNCALTWCWPVCKYACITMHAALRNVTTLHGWNGECMHHHACRALTCDHIARMERGTGQQDHDQTSMHTHHPAAMILAMCTTPMTLHCPSPQFLPAPPPPLRPAHAPRPPEAAPAAGRVGVAPGLWRARLGGRPAGRRRVGQLCAQPALGCGLPAQMPRQRVRYPGQQCVRGAGAMAVGGYRPGGRGGWRA